MFNYKTLDGIKYYIDEETGQLTICAWCGGMTEEGVNHMREVTKKLEKEYSQKGSHGICEECAKDF